MERRSWPTVAPRCTCPAHRSAEVVTARRDAAGLPMALAPAVASSRFDGGGRQRQRSGDPRPRRWGMSKQEIERLDDQGMAAWEWGDADGWVGLVADDVGWY